MLWSFIKILSFIALIMAIAFGASILTDMQGSVVINFISWEMTLRPLSAVIAVLSLLALLWLLLKILGFLMAAARFINGDETALSRFFDRNRERRGYVALSQALLALASGDTAQAMSHAKKADRLLKTPELTHLVLAQAAEKDGQTQKALQTYKQLAARGNTQFIGVLGLLKQKLAAGEREIALKLAQKALQMKPSHSQTQDILFELQTGEEDWVAARSTLAVQYQKGRLSRDIYHRRDGVLSLCEARQNRLLGRVNEAYDKAFEANRLSPALVPAAVWAARAHIAQGAPKLAEKALIRAWKTAPHPQLAAVFATIFPDESTPERLKRFRKLTRLHPQNAETKMLLAELHIAADDFEAASQALGDLPQSDPNVRVMSLLAAIKRGRGADEAEVRDLLNQALKAPPNAQWICENCSMAHKDWEAVCDECSAFDTLTWRRARKDAFASADFLLPLL